MHAPIRSGIRAGAVVPFATLAYRCAAGRAPWAIAWRITFENQAYHASEPNLVVAAVILWNTRYLEHAAADLGVGPDAMRHVAPLG